MDKLFECLPGGWTAQSKFDVNDLASTMHKITWQIGFIAELGNIGSKFLFLSFDGGLVEFREANWGCTLTIKIFQEDNIDIGFFSLWQFCVDKGWVWGGPYRKEIAKEIPTVEGNTVTPEFASEEEWADTWMPFLLALSMKPDRRLKMMYLFSVLMEHSKITTDYIEISRKNKWSEVDKLAQSRGRFYKLAEGICRARSEDPESYIVSESCVVSDIPGFVLRTLINFHNENRDQFKFPNLPKPK